MMRALVILLLVATASALGACGEERVTRVGEMNVIGAVDAARHEAETHAHRVERAIRLRERRVAALRKRRARAMRLRAARARLARIQSEQAAAAARAATAQAPAQPVPNAQSNEQNLSQYGCDPNYTFPDGTNGCTHNYGD
jgi:hypothetical protein